MNPSHVLASLAPLVTIAAIFLAVGWLRRRGVPGWICLLLLIVGVPGLLYGMTILSFSLDHGAHN